MSIDVCRLVHLAQFTDTALPVGGFSFSLALESAVAEGVVHDVATLEAYARNLLSQSASADSVAAMVAWRSAMRGELCDILEADARLVMCRFGAEQRQMLGRMGRKMLELGVRLTDHALLHELLAEVAASRTAGCYPVVQGAVFAVAGLSLRELFAAQHYGTVAMLLSAALRCMRISHLDTQRVMFALASEADERFALVEPLGLDDMHAFAPMTDILAAIHEKGRSRMFMG